MTTTLTDRYVHAATRWLPGRTRQEVAAELRERIDDTIAARGTGTHSEREVLEELGDPLKVAVEYTDRDPVLIGPRWFFVWLRLLVLLLAIVPAVVAAAHAFGAVLDEDGLGTIIGGTIWTWFAVAVQVAFWTTAVFAILEWTGSDPDTGDVWSVDRLPEPSRGQGVADTVASLVFLPAMAALLLWQQFGSPFFHDGERLPILDPSLWGWWIPLVLLIIAAELGQTIWAAVTGWTVPVAIANAILSVGFAAITIPALTGADFLNPEFVSHVGWDPGVVTTTLRWIAAGVAVVCVWEVADGFLKARRAR